MTQVTCSRSFWVRFPARESKLFCVTRKAASEGQRFPRATFILDELSRALEVKFRRLHPTFVGAWHLFRDIGRCLGLRHKNELILMAISLIYRDE